MKKFIVILLQCVVILIGLGALTFMVAEPQFEGRNANATLYQTYFNDPFLAYAYLASIPFFIALYQTFKLLGYIGEDKLFSTNSIKSLGKIKYSTIALIGLIFIPLAYLLIVRPEDDIAGGVAMALFLIFIFSAVAIISVVFEKKLQTGINKL